MFSQHNIHILSDRGRELLFPLSIINGQALYKDVLTIYFPLAYYINAVLFKIFGASLNTIYISQTIYCLIFSFIYFKVCKMFFDRFTSILATISIITSCLFFQHLFGYILPYSYSMTYGLLMFLTALYFLLKAFKTQKNEYFYISSLSASFAICCKIEFFSLFILIPIAMLLYKSKDILFYIKNILSISLFPIITIGLLFINGVTFYDIVKSIDFAKHFASSKSMYKFLQHIGMYPTFSEEYLKLLLASILGIILYCILIFLTVKIYNKLKNKFVLIFPISIFILILWIYTNPYCYTFLLPITVIVLSLCSMKDLLNNPEKLIVILFGMASSVRIFFSMQMNLYG
ncbi:glycosyltransferase family 39 protein, partial [bacterium]|nr:glycosyltransferase family 39 protein [bacterium]